MAKKTEQGELVVEPVAGRTAEEVLTLAAAAEAAAVANQGR